MSIGNDYDPEAIEVLQASLEDAWARYASLRGTVGIDAEADQQTQMALAILEAASQGVRDVHRLSAIAYEAVASLHPSQSEPDRALATASQRPDLTPPATEMQAMRRAI